MDSEPVAGFRRTGILARLSPGRLVAAFALSLLGPARAGAQVEGPFFPVELGVYDPLQGMEPSGRIPRVPLPVDLPNPERWRYIPEGQIKPGNVFERHLVSGFFTPQVFFEQAVGAGGGVALTDIDFRGQRRQEFLGAFLSNTTEGQQKYRLVWRRWLYHQDLPEGGVLLEERSFLDAAGGYQKTLTRRFFGLGPDTPPSAESSYTDEVFDFGARSDVSLPEAGGNWVLTLRLRGVPPGPRAGPGRAHHEPSLPRPVRRWGRPR
jgi:hypothetical protein